MIKEALQYIVGLGKNEIEELHGQTYSTTQLHNVPEATTSAIQVSSLGGMVDYLKSKFDGERNLVVHVVSPTKVVCFDTLNRDKRRNTYIVADAFTPDFQFDRFYDAENFNIQLQSSFKDDVDTDRSDVLRVVGNIKEDEVRNYGDNGVAQSVTAKSGVTSVEDVHVPNPVVLKPYRTFVEIEQPASEFVFRMQSGPRCALFEADGGAWKLEAIENISKHLVSSLAEEVKSGSIVILS
jgi:hypothetical protein